MHARAAELAPSCLECACLEACTLKAGCHELQEDIGRTEQDIGRIGRSLIEVCTCPQAPAAGHAMVP
jgi:hypothetical protein